MKYQNAKYFNIGSIPLGLVFKIKPKEFCFILFENFSKFIN